MRIWVVVAIFLGFVAVTWAWAFHRGPSAGGSDVPVLAAGDQPTREKPTDPGGMKVADIDPLAYDSGRAPPRVENILPAPETPLPQPAPEPKPVAAAPPPAVAPSQPSQMTSQTAALPRPATDAAPPAQPIAPATVAAAEPPPIITAEPVPTPPAAKPMQKAKPMVKAKPAALHEEAKPPAKPADTGPGGYRVQLASFRSQADARAAEGKFRRIYGSALSAVGFSVVPVELGDRGTYYRIIVGPMKQGAATQLCDTLRQHGAACLLAKH
jgi:hypothetical protein